MKISGARSDPYAAAAAAGASVPRPATPAQTAPPTVQAAFLGLSEAEITPAVQAAMATLLTEVEELRCEVARLKARL